MARSCGPCRPPRYLLLGRDREYNLTAVARWEEASSDEVTFQLLAVASDRQRRGFGREALERVFDEITLHAEPHNVEVVHVLAQAHPQNEPSLKLLSRAGFQFHELHNGYHVYALDLDVTGVKSPQVFYPDSSCWPTHPLIV